MAITTPCRQIATIKPDSSKQVCIPFFSSAAAALKRSVQTISYAPRNGNSIPSVGSPSTFFTTYSSSSPLSSSSCSPSSLATSTLSASSSAESLLASSLASVSVVRVGFTTSRDRRTFTFTLFTSTFPLLQHDSPFNSVFPFVHCFA